jgi:hypothetical protein
MTSRTLDFNSSSSTSRNVVRFEVVTGAATTVTVTSASGVLISDVLVDDAGKALSITAGKTSLAIATNSANSLTATFYAYSTSTTAGTVNVSTPASSLRYFVKGAAGAAYNLKDVVFPASILSGEANSNTNKNVVHFQVTDVFGNALTSNAVATLSGTGASFSGAATYDTTRKRWESNVFGTAQANVAMQLVLTATDLSANGFAKPVDYAFKATSAGDLAAQVTALTAQVAALKADYNALAAKWNKRVASKKAPKKAVALK